MNKMWAISARCFVTCCRPPTLPPHKLTDYPPVASRLARLQLPATIFPQMIPNNQAVTIVVSPLISLMLDQVTKLKSLGISAEYVASSKPAAVNAVTLKNVANHHLLYVTPELVATEKFRGTLKSLHKESKLAMFALDEVRRIE